MPTPLRILVLAFRSGNFPFYELFLSVFLYWALLLSFVGVGDRAGRGAGLAKYCCKPFMVDCFFEIYPVIGVHFQEFSQQIFRLKADMVPMLTFNVISSSDCIQKCLFCIALCKWESALEPKDDIMITGSKGWSQSKTHRI